MPARGNVLKKDLSAPFAVIRRSILDQDTDLSWRAKGLLTYLLNRPPDWTFYRKDIVNRSSDGRTSVQSGLDELQEAGYLTIDDARTNGGLFRGSTWTITDKRGGLPEVGESVVGESTSNELEGSDKKNTHKTHNNGNGTDSDHSIPVREMWEVWVDVVWDGETSRQLTEKRKGHFRQLWHEHLSEEDDWRELMAHMLHAMLNDDWWGERRDTWVPEKAFKNTERREDWAMKVKEESPKKSRGRHISADDYWERYG